MGIKSAISLDTLNGNGLSKISVNVMPDVMCIRKYYIILSYTMLKTDCMYRLGISTSK